MKITHLISVLLEHAPDRMRSRGLPIMGAEEGSSLFAHVGMVPCVAAGVNAIDKEHIILSAARVRISVWSGVSPAENILFLPKKQDEDVNFLLYGYMVLLRCFLHP